MNISQEMLELLTEQISHERFNSQLYLKIGAYFKNMGLDNISEFFYEQSIHEGEHQKMIVDYLTDRNVKVNIKMIPEVEDEFNNILEIANKYLSQEQMTTQKIKNICNLALEEEDLLTYQYFMEKFIKEQIEEESTAQTFLDKCKLTNDLLLLDHTYEK